jgi:hypothetical protein
MRICITDRGRQYLKHLKTAFPERQYITNINKSNAHYFTNEIKYCLPRSFIANTLTA